MMMVLATNLTILSTERTHSAQTTGCVDPDCAIIEVHLNACTPFKPTLYSFS
jgi:hypothetical protein